MSRRKMLAAILAGFLMLLLGVTAPPRAMADTTPDVWDTSELSPQDLRVHGDGSVTMTDCRDYSQQTDSSLTYAAKTFASNGDVINEIPVSTSDSWLAYTCQQASAVGTDNTFFVTQDKNSGNQHRLAAYKNGAMRWAHVYECNSGQDLRLEATALGADGNVYGVFYNPGSSQACSEYPDEEKVLIGINVADGSELFREPLDVEEPWNTVQLFAQSDRLVVKTARELLFYEYDGTELAAQAVSAGTSAVRFDYSTGLTDGATIYYLRKENRTAPDDCWNYRTKLSLYKKQGSQSESSVNIGECEEILSMDALSDGGVAYVYVDRATSQWKLKRLDGTGGVDFDQVISSLSGQDVFMSNVLTADMVTASSDGDVYLKRSIKVYPSDSHSDLNLRIDKFDDEGTMTEVFSTDELDEPNVAQNYRAVGSLDGGLAGDRLYVPYCKNPNSCSALAQSGVVAVDLSVGSDYPRSSIFAEHQQLNYVALGDSFSSGEGVEPFYEGTNVSEEETEDEDLQNMCHRSKKAYSEVLNNTPESGLILTKFAACSGAETKHVLTTEQWNEGKQIDALNADTDFVTITIGGNDMGFRRFAEYCASVGTGSVNCSGQPYDEAMANIEDVVAPNIEDTLDAIDSKLSNAGSDAQVLVIGYPQILPETWVSPSSTDCIWLFEDEHYAIRDVIDTLNDTIKDKVEDKGGRFTFVPVNGTNSPFNGHGLCQQSSQSYFNGPILGQNVVYSFHPNAYGQEAYKTIILNELG